MDLVGGTSQMWLADMNPNGNDVQTVTNFSSYPSTEYPQKAPFLFSQPVLCKVPMIRNHLSFLGSCNDRSEGLQMQQRVAGGYKSYKYEVVHVGFPFKAC